MFSIIVYPRRFYIDECKILSDIYNICMYMPIETSQKVYYLLILIHRKWATNLFHFYDSILFVSNDKLWLPICFYLHPLLFPPIWKLLSISSELDLAIWNQIASIFLIFLLDKFDKSSWQYLFYKNILLYIFIW